MRSRPKVVRATAPDSIEADLGFSSLQPILDPVLLRRHLECFSLSPWSWGEISDLQVQLIVWKGARRCTVDITVHTGTGLRRLIGKAYALDRSDVFQAMVRISQAGFDAEAEFSVPQPLAYLPELHLLLQERVEGPLAKHVFRTGNDRDRVEGAERCARWLGRFHTVAPREGSIFDLNGHLESLGKWSRSMADSGDPLAAKVTLLFQRLERAASSLRATEVCARHGDFTAAQVILAPGRTVTFDWDSHGVADPSRDVARFIASLERTALEAFGSMRALDHAAAVFLKTYLAVGRPEVQYHLPFYKAARHLQIVRRKIGKPDWNEKNEAALDEGLRVLEQR